MSKAILTKFHGPTNTRGSRYSATDADHNRVTISADYGLNSEENHRAAAIALCDKMHWKGADTLIAGGLANGYVFVFPDASIIRTGTRYRVRFVYDDQASFEESNGEPRPLTEEEYQDNQYMGCPDHPRGYQGTKANDTSDAGRGTCACGKAYAPIPYDEYRAYYGNPEKHVYLGCIVEAKCNACDIFRTVEALWNIDCMIDDRDLHSVTISTLDQPTKSGYLSEDEARKLAGYLGEVARELLEEARAKKGGK